MSLRAIAKQSQALTNQEIALVVSLPRNDRKREVRNDNTRELLFVFLARYEIRDTIHEIRDTRYGYMEF